ncbi:MAG TPA: hypothetical protein VMP03_09690 [Methylomirabilota bacterium]|nr:hypothetical protein [Methylomirabilota bacterium]
MTLLRLVPAIAALLLVGAIAAAAVTADFAASFAMIMGDPWGIVTLVDLYAGFAVVLVLIALLEPRRAVTGLAILATPVLGSLVPAAWLYYRLPLIVALVRRAA